MDDYMVDLITDAVLGTAVEETSEPLEKKRGRPKKEDESDDARIARIIEEKLAEHQKVVGVQSVEVGSVADEILKKSGGTLVGVHGDALTLLVRGHQICVNTKQGVEGCLKGIRGMGF